MPTTRINCFDVGSKALIEPMLCEIAVRISNHYITEAEDLDIGSDHLLSSIG